MASCLFVALFSLFIWHAFSSDSTQLQDFCVADLSSQVFVNGYPCKNPNLVTSDDFFFTGLDKAGNTTNILGANVTSITVENLPALNTLGISLFRHDFAPTGMVPPHYHPRATEILFVIEGTIEAVVLSSMDEPALFSKNLNKGDVFVFPQGMLHYHYNFDTKTNAVAFSAMSSQNPGTVYLANLAFRANPPISDDVLTKAFLLDKKTMEWLQAQFTHDDTH